MKVKFEIEMPEDRFKEIIKMFNSKPLLLSDIFKHDKAVISHYKRSKESIYGTGAVPVNSITTDGEIDLVVVPR